MTVKKLSLEDIDAIREFSFFRKNLWLIENYDGGNFLSRIENNLSTANSPYIYWAVFQEQNILFFIGIRKWVALPYCTLLDMCSVTDDKFEINVKACIRIVMPIVLDYLEANRIFSFYYLLKKSHVGLHARTNYDGKNTLLSLLPSLSKYFFTIEAEIPKNTISQYEVFFQMMGRRAYPVDLIVRRGALRSQFFIK